MTTQQKAPVIYMDHAATTAVDPRVVEAMLPFFSGRYGNPSSLYGLGQEAARVIDGARERVAAVLHARGSEIIFTSGGTESDNAALRGAAYALQASGDHIVTTAMEHHAVLHTCEWLERRGFRVTYLKPDAEGLVSAAQVAEAVTERTTVVSVMSVNNEVGSIQPIGEIARAVKEKARALKRQVVVHTDAVQAAGWLPLDVQALGVDMLSLSSHKFNGPKGVGVLYVRHQSPFEPQAMGGSQERNRRAGTENTPGIVGTGLALALAEAAREEAVTRVSALRDRLLEGVLAVPGTRLNGPSAESGRRLANNVNVSFSGVEIESVLINLDMQGVAASSGSACTSGSIDPSHVLVAMGVPHEAARSSLRLTLGRENTVAEVERVLELLPPIIQRVRALNGPPRSRAVRQGA